jgi:hypothetical protein
VSRQPSDNEKHVDFSGLAAAIDATSGQLVIAFQGTAGQVLRDIESQLAKMPTLVSTTALSVLAPERMVVAFGDALKVGAEAGVALGMAEVASQGLVAKRPSIALMDTAMERRGVATAAVVTDYVALTTRTELLRRTQDKLTTETRRGIMEWLSGLRWSFPADQLGGAAVAAVSWGRLHTLAAAAPPSTDLLAASAPEPGVYASELLDRKTCDECGDVDGKTYASLEDGLRDYPAGGFKDCRGRARCRGTLVVVYPEG